MVDGTENATASLPEVIHDAQAKVAANPKLVKQLAAMDHSDAPGPMTDDMRAKRVVEQTQNDVITAQNAAYVLQPQAIALDERGDGLTKQRSDLATKEKTLGPDSTPAEVDSYNRAVSTYNAALTKYNGDAVRLQKKLDPITARIDRAQTTLRTIDVHIAGASGDPEFGRDLARANEDLNTIRDMGKKVHATTADPSLRPLRRPLDTMGDLASLHYDSVARAPRSAKNGLGDMPLPSTGRPDFTKAQNASINLPDFPRDLTVFNKPLTGEKESLWDQLGRDEKGRDKRATIAAYNTPQEWEKTLLGTPEALERTVTGIEGDSDRREAFDAWLKSGVDYDRLTSYLSSDEKSQLADERKRAEDAAPPGSGPVSSALHKVGNWVSDGLKDHAEFIPIIGGYKNLPWTDGAVDDGIDVVSYAPEGVTHMAENLGKGIRGVFIDNTWQEPREPGESFSEKWARVEPFTGLFVTSGVNSYHRFQPLIHGNTDKLLHGDPKNGLTGYADKPVSSLLEDIALPSIVLGGAGIAAKTMSTGARASAATSLAEAGAATTSAGRAAVLGRTAAALGKRADRLDTAARFLNAPAKVAVAPIRVWTGAGRLAASAASRALEPVAATCRSACSAAGARAVDAAASGNAAAAANLTTASRTFGAAAGALEGTARTAASIGRYGLTSVVRTPLAYRRLGVTKDSTPEQIARALQDRQRQVRADMVGDRSFAAMTLGPKRAAGVRLGRLDRQYDRVRGDQQLRNAPFERQAARAADQARTARDVAAQRAADADFALASGQTRGPAGVRAAQAVRAAAAAAEKADRAGVAADAAAARVRPGPARADHVPRRRHRGRAFLHVRGAAGPRGRGRRATRLGGRARRDEAARHRERQAARDG